MLKRTSLGLHEGGGRQEVVVLIIMLGGGNLKERILIGEEFVLFDKGMIWRLRGHMGVFFLLGGHVGVGTILNMRSQLGRRWLGLK